MAEGELAEIRERLEKATPGPWEADVFTKEEGPVVISEAPEFALDDSLKHIVGGESNNEGIDFPTGLAWADAEFIAHARTDMRRLLEEVSRLKAEIHKWKANHDAAVSRCALLRQRPDLPADRIPAADAYEALIEEKDAENLRISAKLILASEVPALTLDDFAEVFRLLSRDGTTFEEAKESLLKAQENRGDQSQLAKLPPGP